MRSNKQNGNVLFLILIAVALFAALSYAVTLRNSDTGKASKEKTATDIAQVQNYAASLRTAVNRLMLSNGCPDDQINFSSSNWVDNYGYSNRYSPSDGRCDIFSSKGGGVSWQKPPTSFKALGAKEYLISGIFGVWNVGIDSCDKTEMMMFADVTRDVCLLANAQNGITNPGGNPPQADTGEFSTPPGYLASGWHSDVGGANYGCGAHFAVSSSSAMELLGKTAGCYQTDGGRREYYYYEVLLAR